MGNIILGIRTLYKAILHGLKMKAENEKVNDSVEIDTILIIVTISQVVRLQPPQPVGFVPNMKSGLIRDEPQKDLQTKIRKRQTQLEEFRQESTTPLHKEMEERVTQGC